MKQMEVATGVRSALTCPPPSMTQECRSKGCLIWPPRPRDYVQMSAEVRPCGASMTGAGKGRGADQGGKELQRERSPLICAFSSNSE